MAKRNDDNSSGSNSNTGGGGNASNDDPIGHDLNDDRGVDDPATHDVGDDHGMDDPATHDVGDDHGVDDPATHDVGDDHGGDRLHLVQNARTGQWIFTDDSTEATRWADDHGHRGGEVERHAPRAVDDTVSVWRFHDPASDVYFWTADARLKDDLQRSQPNLEFEGEAFRAYSDDASGGTQAIGLVWDRGDGPYGNFTYAPNDDAVQLAGQSSSDDLIYLGVAFWI